MLRFLAAVVAALLLVFTLSLPVSAEAGIDGGTNAYRQSQGRSTLATHSTLQSFAAMRAQEIVGVFAHPTNWDYIWPSDCEWIGENIAWSTGTMGSDWAVNAWANSPSHRANMLGDWTHQGSALIYVDGKSYAVQLFGRCGSAPAPAAPAPAAPQPVRTAAPAPQASQETSTPVLPDTAMPVEP